MINVTRMTFNEVKSTLILSLIFACRMLGLFMVLPVLALYKGKIAGATPALMGLAAGIYGFSQAIFQWPSGILSDRFGRRPVILLGLMVFGLGSLIAALYHSIWGLIWGRAIQGMGAIGSPLLALVADSTREQVRTRAMALIGMTIGMTFVFAILLGPLLDAYIGLRGIFWFTLLLTIGAMLLLVLVKDQPCSAIVARSVGSLKQQRDLWYLNLNIFMLHAILMAIFLVLPPKIQELSNLTSAQVWRFYVPVLSAAMIGVMPFLRYADGPWQRKLLNAALLILGLGVLLLICASGFYGLMVAAVLFFAAFNFLEASFPAVVSRMVPAKNKGSALGLYSCSQFLGMFTGGLLGGILQQWLGDWAIGASCITLLGIGALALQAINYFKVLTKNKACLQQDLKQHY